jgi:hypothetical protein
MTVAGKDETHFLNKWYNMYPTEKETNTFP